MHQYFAHLAIIFLGVITSVSAYSRDFTDTVDLECRGEKLTGRIPEYASALHQFTDKRIYIVMTRKQLTIGEESIGEFVSKTSGRSIEDSYVFENLGENIQLVFPTAGPFLGAKTATIRWRATSSTRPTKSFAWTFKCKNLNPAEQASFLKLCKDKPELKETYSCKAISRLTFGLPEKMIFAPTRTGLNAEYETEEDPPEAREVRMKFYPAPKPGFTSGLRYIEHCTYSAAGVRADRLNGLMLSRELVETGKGIAVAPETSSDGGSYIWYLCR